MARLTRMGDFENLPNAPITEAAIEVGVALASPLSSRQWADVRAAFLPSFPDVEEKDVFLEILARTDPPPAAGLVMKSADRHEAIQLDERRFAFSRLRPYTSWPEVVGEARKHWRAFADLAVVESVTQLGARYVNYFQIDGAADVGEFLTAAPRVPQIVEKQDVTGMFAQYAFTDRPTRVRSRVLQFTNRLGVEMGVIVDIHVTLSQDFSADEESLWRHFETLREMKNRIFFNSLTEKALEMFR